VLAVQLLLGATVVVPFLARVSPHLDSSVHAPALSGDPDAYDRARGWEAGVHPGLWSDVKRLEEPAFAGLSVATFFLLTVAWLFGAVAAGGFLGTALDARGASVGRFFAHGGQWFGRMLRVGLLFALAYVVLGRLVFEAWGGSVESSERASASDASVWRAARIREATFVLLFLWLRVVADVARADLVAFGRKSAFLAFTRAFGRSIRRPIATFGPALALGAPAFALLIGLGIALDLLDTGPAATIAASFVVVQVAVLVRWASRAAVLGAYASRAVPAPIARAAR
jgi:hypothetical protein